MLEDGPRGLSGPRLNAEGDQDELEGEDISLYGIDWEVMEDEVLVMHHHQHNPVLLNNPFSTVPATLSEVECTPPDCSRRRGCLSASLRHQNPSCTPLPSF